MKKTLEEHIFRMLLAIHALHSFSQFFYVENFLIPLIPGGGEIVCSKNFHPLPI